jgi:hypothetical protein
MVRDYSALFIATETFGAFSQIVFPIGSSSQLSAKRSTFTRFFTARGTIVDGQSDCERRSISLK